MSTENTPTPKVELFGLSICNLTYEELCRRISERVEAGQPGYIVTPNVDHVCRYHRDPSFQAAYREAAHVLADGMPVVWAARLFGRPIREKLSGSDLLPRLTEYAAERGYSVFYLGAAEGVAEEVARRLEERHPGLRVKGTYSPPYGFEKDPEANAEVLRRLHEAKPDICFVALGSPKQEVWLHENCIAAGVPVLIGVGAAFDFVAGRVRRAPVWMQKSGMEWLWRLSQEPRRLARRYLVDDCFFLALLWREIKKRRRAHALKRA
jgi:N-acetylglucosaminyldiphosphoundecaprenol N-acetyl-beta-D-mannosaminyltransferase